MNTGNYWKQDEDEVRAALRRAVPPAETELRRDLWPNMLRRMEETAPAAPVPWYDWALGLALVAAVFLYPKLLLLFAYHL